MAKDSNSLPFYELRNVTDGAVIQSQLWDKAKAIELATTLNKASNEPIKVYKVEEIDTIGSENLVIDF